MDVSAERVNHASALLLTVLCVTALLDVLLLGYLRPPLPDEGMGAHIFQLSIAALLPTGVLFLATSDWSKPVRVAWRLAAPAVLGALAFAALYYLEHYYYPAHYR